MKVRYKIKEKIGLIIFLIHTYCLLPPFFLNWAQAKDFDFPEIAGWKKISPILIFKPQNLYDYIDGAADLYLSYDFQELLVGEYKGPKKASVTVEIYRHRNPTLAFGIYSQERLKDAQIIEIGNQGYIEPLTLNFWIGPYYVKINAYEIGPEGEKTLLIFGKQIEAALGEKSSPPAILSLFPTQGKKANSESFIFKNFLGYAFFHSAFMADYEWASKKFKIFVMQGKEKNECQEMMGKYLQKIGVSHELKEGLYRLPDPYHGEIEFFWQENLIWGILNLDDQNLRAHYWKSMKIKFLKY